MLCANWNRMFKWNITHSNRTAGSVWNAQSTMHRRFHRTHFYLILFLSFILFCFAFHSLRTITFKRVLIGIYAMDGLWAGKIRKLWLKTATANTSKLMKRKKKNHQQLIQKLCLKCLSTQRVFACNNLWNWIFFNGSLVDVVREAMARK